MQRSWRKVLWVVYPSGKSICNSTKAWRSVMCCLDWEASRIGTKLSLSILIVGIFGRRSITITSVEAVRTERHFAGIELIILIGRNMCSGFTSEEKPYEKEWDPRCWSPITISPSINCLQLINFATLFTETEYQLNHSSWGGAVALWLVRSTPERALRSRALAWDIVLCS